MQRKQAWITAAVVAVVFVAASLAVMANTGLLRLGDVDHQVGRLAPGSVTVATIGAPPAGAPPATGAPDVVIRYEDIYVAAPPAAGAPATNPAGGTAPAAATVADHTPADHTPADQPDPIVAATRPAAGSAVGATRRTAARTRRPAAAPGRTERHEGDDHDDHDDDDHEEHDDDD